jgi:transposase
MDAIVERCCGVDVGEASLTACLLVGKSEEKPRKTLRTVGTVTQDLIGLRDWLISEGCTHVAMEATGVYWIPIFAVLEGYFDVTIANAQHIKAVPGRKTDVKDAEWIADLLRHGLLKKSFVPPAEIRELRDLVRYRRKLIEGRTAERNRVLKFLEEANVKLASVVSDVFGTSGMLMLRALITGEATPEEMARMAKGRMRKKRRELELALEGRVQDHHRFVLGLQIRRLEQMEADIALIEARIQEKLRPFRTEVELLMTIPGVSELVAAAIIAEIGVDMSVFGSASRLSSWAGICPGNHESAGKRKKVGSRRGNPYLKTILVEAGNAAAHTRGTYFHDKLIRLQARRGRNRALIALAHKLLIVVFHVLAERAPYRELGPHYLDTLKPTRTAQSLVRRLQRMGYSVQIQKAAA